MLSEDRVLQRQKERIDYVELPPKSCLSLHVHQREPNKDCDLHLLADLQSKVFKEIPQNTEETFNVSFSFLLLRYSCTLYVVVATIALMCVETDKNGNLYRDAGVTAHGNIF